VYDDLGDEEAKRVTGRDKVNDKVSATSGVPGSLKASCAAPAHISGVEMWGIWRGHLDGSRLVAIRGCIQVLDEDYFVADCVVEQLVDGAACEKKTVSSGAHSLLLA
jgi:hypothetical protein